MFSAIRSFGKRHPKLHALLVPAWPHFLRMLWVVHKGISGRKPVTFKAGDHTIVLTPVGQIAEFMWCRAFEKEERDFAVRAMKPGMRVLNIGANAGLYTLIASKIIGPTGDVHSFEPSSRNFDLLKKNIALNQCKNVTANNMAVSNFQGQLSLHCDPLHPDFDGHFFVRRLPETPDPSLAPPMEIVPCTTVDEYWRAACGGEIKPVDFIVIDVEGAELSVFQGARQTFAASPSVAMIMECTENIDETGVFLAEMGFTFYTWDMNSSKLLPVKIGRGSFIALKGLQATYPGNS